jgi:ABC-type phosphate transport system substrate-binding protein
MKRSLAAAAVAAVFLGVLGSTGCGGGDKITLVGRQNSSGTYDYFREAVLAKGEFRSGVSAQSGSKEVVELIGKTPSAIGYSGMGYVTEDVKMLKVKGKGEPVGPSIETVRAGTYPLARPLYVYSVGTPSGAIKHYLEWIKSSEGQQVLKDEGCVPNIETPPPPTEKPEPGNISVEGSDTMIQVAGKWAEIYMKKYPEVKIAVKGGGSGNGIKSLRDGTCDLCNSSREMTAKEKEEAKAKSMKEVNEAVVGLDAIAIFVHKSNKLEQITLEQLKEIYGQEGSITTWSQLTGSEKVAQVGN